jgi:RecA-family ATPase
MNKKFENIDKKIEQSKERKRLFTIKHRELENLKFGDFQDIRNSHKNKGFKEKCDIVEKHIGMSISLNEKRQQLQQHNDKLRNKMAKERFKSMQEQGGAKTTFNKVLREQVSVAAYAPDIVKWTAKDMKKIMAIDKGPNDDR